MALEKCVGQTGDASSRNTDDYRTENQLYKLKKYIRSTLHIFSSRKLKNLPGVR